MEIDTSNLTDEQISKLSEFIHTMEEENKVTKWWIMPKYNLFSKEEVHFGQSYYVEPEDVCYSKNRPPLKSGFESKEAAEKWLKDYLKEEDLFSKAKDEINYLKGSLEQILARFNRHEYLTKDDWDKYFNVIDHGILKEVTK